MTKTKDDPIQIKRYPNRRFYAREAKAYVSLGEIEKMIRSGRTVEIVDNKTGEDITRLVLTQIIIDRYPDKMDLFPTAMLHSILQANDQMSQFFREYFQSCLSYLDQFQKNDGQFPPQQPMNWMGAWMDAMMPPSYNREGEAKEATQQGTVDDSTGYNDRSNEELVQRLEEMEKRLRDLESGS